jgi:hypothetical protein
MWFIWFKYREGDFTAEARRRKEKRKRFLREPEMGRKMNCHPFAEVPQERNIWIEITVREECSNSLKSLKSLTSLKSLKGIFKDLEEQGYVFSCSCCF